MSDESYNVYGDVLSRASIGSWKIEIVEGQEPRMWADTTMMRLIGVQGRTLTPEEMYHAWYDHIDKDHYVAVHEGVTLMTNGQHAEIQYPWHHPDGTVIIVRCGGVRDFGYKEGVRIAGIHQWVTELHHIELNLKKSSAAVDETLSAITRQLYGYNMTVDLTDGAYSMIRGTGTDTILELADRSKSFREFYDANMMRIRPEFRDRCRELCSFDFMRNNCAKSGYFGTVEYIVDSPDGERWEEANVTFGLNADGHPIANILGRDITAAKQATARHDQELKAAAAKDQLLSGITKALYAFNVTVNLETGRYSLITGTVGSTESICSVFEAYRAEDYSKAIEVIIAYVGDEHKSACRSLLGRDYLMAQRDRGGYLGSGEFPWTSTEGVPRWCEFNVFIGSDEKGAPLANILGRDITDARMRAATEQELIVARQASAAKTKFLSTLSHDIRTPMNSILGMTTIAQTHIRQHAERGVDDATCLAEVNRCLDNVQVASNHMLGLVNDILDMSRMESGRFSMNELPFSLDEITEHVTTIIRQQADSKGLKFSHLEKGVKHRHFVGDAMRINQIFINILNNSVKFTGSGGEIRWDVEERSGASADEVSMVFTCTDTGRGMSADFMPHLFEPFVQEGRQTSDTYVGTGLGMAIVGQLVELMHGTVTVESELGKGTTFTVMIPMRIDNDVTKTQRIEAQGREAGLDLITKCRFLVVDDVPANAEVITQMLMLAGGRCEIATDGAKGYEMFRDSKPGYFDCILMDVRMPVMNGYEATKAIRSLNREDAKSIPIIAMTADAFADDVRLAMESGMDAHVSKPVRFKTLAETLARIIA